MTLASVLLAALGFMVLIVLHEAGHFAAAKWVGMRVERFALFFPPLVWRKQVGETEYALGTIPLGGYVRISGMNPSEDLPAEVRDRAYHAQPPWKRMVVIAAGPLVNLLLAFILLFAYLAFIGPRDPARASGTVDAIEKGYPAATALKPGDRLISVDGVTGDPGDLSEAISEHECAGTPTDGCRAATPARLVIERNGERRPLELRPMYDADAQPEGRTRLGFAYLNDGPRDPYPLGQAFTQTGDRLWLLTKETVKLPARLFDAEKRKEISGLVGSYEYTRQTILDDVADVLAIMALISLSLAIVNLFPFLPLDGGHIFWAIVEKVRRKPVPFAVMERAGVIGFLLVIGLFFIGLTNDIDRLSGEGFEVR
ncbi:MAG: regulator of sigma protease [Thermoleophilaceae bacterium]|jgi:regulator of sigma E protease|nr:regulator of sigma protease [Thermoleophilaceae bacterium]